MERPGVVYGRFSIGGSIPMAELPSRDEVAQLPLRAIVAYAARCARRAQPHYRLPEAHPDLRRHVSALDRTLALAEDLAADQKVERIAEAADDAYAAAVQAGVGFAAVTSSSAATFAAEAAFLTAETAASASGDAVPYGNDYDRLLQIVLGRPHNFDEPIDATENGPLGPLWRHGRPDWDVEGREWIQRVLGEPMGTVSADQ